jgi:hypothetical protein
LCGAQAPTLVRFGAIFRRFVTGAVGAHGNFTGFPVLAIIVLFAIIEFLGVINARTGTGWTGFGIPWTYRAVDDADLVRGAVVIGRTLALDRWRFYACAVTGWAGRVCWAWLAQGRGAFVVV